MLTQTLAGRAGWRRRAVAAAVQDAAHGSGAVLCHPFIPRNDLLSAMREALNEAICRCAWGWAIGLASVEEIDRLNILQATLVAMQRAVRSLPATPDEVWVDGNRLPLLDVPARAIVGGDASQACIGAASILAKVHRDRLCEALHRQHPDYGFDVHKGYPTRLHLARLHALGPCAAHRRSFAPVRAAVEALG